MYRRPWLLAAVPCGEEAGGDRWLKHVEMKHPSASCYMQGFNLDECICSFCMWRRQHKRISVRWFSWVLGVEPCRLKTHRSNLHWLYDLSLAMTAFIHSFPCWKHCVYCSHFLFLKGVAFWESFSRSMCCQSRHGSFQHDILFVIFWYIFILII
jgi:hypothetical protein